MDGHDKRKRDHFHPLFVSNFHDFGEWFKEIPIPKIAASTRVIVEDHTIRNNGEISLKTGELEVSMEGTHGPLSYIP